MKAILAETKRLILSLVGIVLLLVGIVMLVAPGPGILLILAGLAVLAKEYSWPRRILGWLKEKLPGSDRPGKI